MRIEATPRWRSDEAELFLLEPRHVSAEYVGWLNDPQINRYLESRFAVHDEEGTRAFVAAMLASEHSVFFGIRSPALGGRHVGNIKLGPMDRRHGLGEIGLIVGEKAAWGKGLATASIRLLTGIARDELGLRKLSAGCYAGNGGSARAFEKAGFTLEARRPQHYLVDGRPEDVLLLGRIL